MDLHNLKQKLDAHFPIIVVETHDEQAVIDLFRMATTESKKYGQLRVWSASHGLEITSSVDSSSWKIEGEAQYESSNNTALIEPVEMLKAVKSKMTECVLIFPDFHGYLSNPLVVRLIKEIALQYYVNGITMVFISHDFPVPSEIERMCTHFDLSIPSIEKVNQLIKDEARVWLSKNNEKVRGDAKAIDLLTKNLVGLTEADARRFIRGAIYDDGAITHSDVKSVMDAKYRMLSPDGAITYSFDTHSFSDVGGFEKLKQWLEVRKPFFLEQVEQHFDVPKGVLLLGVQGCGKSLAAKAVAGVFGVPLLNLDFGALFNKYIGETEKNLRDAIKAAEMLEPCVLWIDEIEKALSGGNDDTGTSTRILGTLLTWMAENKRKVFVVATSNNIESLPPELLRKGRFDEIYFVDLPSSPARHAIFDIHLSRRNLNTSDFDLAQLVAASEGYSGAEIEQAIVSAGYWAHAQSEKMSTNHILKELENTQPLSIVRAESIEALRRWAGGRTVKVD